MTENKFPWEANSLAKREARSARGESMTGGPSPRTLALALRKLSHHREDE
jgi:hypothetical protein